MIKFKLSFRRYDDDLVKIPKLTLGRILKIRKFVDGSKAVQSYVDKTLTGSDFENFIQFLWTCLPRTVSIGCLRESVEYVRNVRLTRERLTFLVSRISGLCAKLVDKPIVMSELFDAEGWNLGYFDSIIAGDVQGRSVCQVRFVSGDMSGYLGEVNLSEKFLQFLAYDSGFSDKDPDRLYDMPQDFTRLYLWYYIVRDNNGFNLLKITPASGLASRNRKIMEGRVRVCLNCKVNSGRGDLDRKKFCYFVCEHSRRTCLYSIRPVPFEL